MIEPGYALARHNRGYARFTRGEHDQAIADYSAAIRLDPRLGWAYPNRYPARAMAGREAGLAAADWDRAQRLLPNHPRVRETLAFVRRDVADAQPSREFTTRISN
ncbi:MAG: tetratricopeptide repeat protein [Reyranella sp.]|nr:tetratricopeptide repeat protein [Reyranella sp.]